MKDYEIIIIGGGPAGITLSKKLAPKMKVAVIRPEDYSMIYCAMPYAIEGLFPIEQTFKKDALVTDSGADLIRSSVTKVDFDKKIVLLENDERVSYEKLIIATGANPFIPAIKGNKLEGILGFKTEIDMRKILKNIESGIKKIVVVGAGAIGIELALALKKIELEVHLVDMAQTVLPNLIDAEMSEKIYEEIVDLGINLHLKTKISELIGSKFVEQVILDNGSKINFDSIENSLSGMVVFSTGMTPAVSIFKKSNLEIGKDGIIINPKMQTNLKDVFAVGDCTQFYSGITNKPYPGKLATNAVPMAKILAFNLLGQDREYPGFFNGSATKVGKYYVGGTGLSERIANENGFETICGYSEVTSKFPIMPDAKKMRLKLISDAQSKKLIGAQIISEEPVTDKIDTLTLAIQNQLTIMSLTQLSYSAQPYQSFYPAANLIVLATEDILLQF